MQISSVGLSAG